MHMNARRVPRADLTPSQPSVATDEATLVARVRDGDAQAFEVVFRTYYSTLCEVVGTMVRSRDAATEVVSETFLALWRRRAAWQPQGALLPYLIGSARHQALTYLARAKRETLLEQRAVQNYEADGVLPGMGHTSDTLGDHEQWNALHLAIRELPPGRRAVLLLRWQHQMSFRDIASALGISVRTAESQHLRAMQTLRDRLTPRI